jgi:hypothetical protein
MTRMPSPAAELRTPHARLSEAPLHDLVGYRLAQATIVTDHVFDERVRRTGLRRSSCCTRWPCCGGSRT